MDIFKSLKAAIGGLVGAYLNIYLSIIIVVFVSVMFDIVTGVIASIISGEGINSKRAYKGVLKKCVLFVALAFGTFLDYMIQLASSQLGFEMPAILLFSSAIGFYIAFTECVSVCENIFKCCPGAFPKWLTKILTNGKKYLDDLGDKNND
jgi:hypothetical protein